MQWPWIPVLGSPESRLFWDGTATCNPACRKLKQEDFEFWGGLWWLHKQRCLSLSLTTWAQSLGPIWKKEKMDSLGCCLTSTDKPLTSAQTHTLPHKWFEIQFLKILFSKTEGNPFPTKSFLAFFTNIWIFFFITACCTPLTWKTTISGLHFHYYAYVHRSCEARLPGSLSGPSPYQATC